MKALVAVLRFHWGFSLRQPFASKATEPLPVPQPTTIVGALAAAHYHDKAEYYVYGRRLYSRSLKLVSDFGIKWATSGWLDLFTLSSTLIRYFSGPYQSRKTREEDTPKSLIVSNLFAPINIGIAVAPGSRMFIAVFGDRVDELKDDAYSIYRLGSKESLVAVEQVDVLDVKEVEGQVCRVASALLHEEGYQYEGFWQEFSYYMFERNGKFDWGCAYALSSDALSGCAISERRFILPLPPDYVCVNGFKGSVVEFEYGGEKYVAVWPHVGQ